MPIPGIPQPEVLDIDDTLRLRRYDGQFADALAWYQDPETLLLVDGKTDPYDLGRLEGMYTYLNAHGELYWIELRTPDGGWRKIGDVTFSREDMPIVLGEKSLRGRGIGGRVVSRLIRRGRALGYDRLEVGEIYDFNEGSRRCFTAQGFAACEATPRGHRYRLELRGEDTHV
mgnify:FL=1